MVAGSNPVAPIPARQPPGPCPLTGHTSGRSAARSARLLREQEVGSSNLPAPIRFLQQLTSILKSLPTSRARCVLGRYARTGDEGLQGPADRTWNGDCCSFSITETTNLTCNVLDLVRNGAHSECYAVQSCCEQSQTVSPVRGKGQFPQSGRHKVTCLLGIPSSQT